MKTLFTGQSIVRLDSVDSTNNYLQKLVQKNPVAEGTVVIALEQKLGKGQRGNRWQSEPGKNLTLSALLSPKFLEAQHHFMINKVVSLAVADTVAEMLNVEVKIKWPNDILVNEKKIGGILIENTVSGNTIQHAVIGIGLNVNQTHFADLPNATSFLNSLSQNNKRGIKEFSLNEVMEALCSTLEKRYLQLRNQKQETINADYLSSIYLLNKEVDFMFNSEKITASITGVSALGKLQLKKTTGEKLEADFKEVAFP